MRDATRPATLPRIPQGTGESPEDEMTWPKISAVPRLRNLAFGLKRSEDISLELQVSLCINAGQRVPEEEKQRQGGRGWERGRERWLGKG